MSWLSDLYKKLTNRAKTQSNTQSSRRDHTQKPKPSSSQKPKSNSGRSNGGSSKPSSSSRGGSTTSRPSYSSSTYRRPSTTSGSTAVTRGTRGTRQVGGQKRETATAPKVTVTKAQTVTERASSTPTKQKSKGTALTVTERKQAAEQARTNVTDLKSSYKKALDKGRNAKNKTVQSVKTKNAAKKLDETKGKTLKEQAQDVVNNPKYFKDGKYQINALGGKVKTDTLKYGKDEKKNVIRSKKDAETPRSERKLMSIKTDKDPAPHDLGPMVQSSWNKGVADQQAKKLSKKENRKIDKQVEKIEKAGQKVDEDVVKALRKQVSKKNISKQIYENLEKDRIAKNAKEKRDHEAGKKKGTLKSEQLTMEEYQKLQNASRLGKKVGNKALGKDLAEKVGSRTAYSAGKNKISKAATGAMQGLAYGDVLHGGVGKYNNGAKQVLKETKESGAYNIGYAGGQMAGSVLGGTSGMAKSLAQKGAKAGAEAVAKSAGKQFVKNRVIESAVEAPMNALDAAKMARDEKGKINTKEFAKYMGINTAMTGVAGGAMEGASVAFTKRNASELLRLQAKSNVKKLTAEEGQKLSSLYKKLDAARKDLASPSSGIADDAYKKARKGVEDARLDRKRAKAGLPPRTAEDVAGTVKKGAAKPEAPAVQNVSVETPAVKEAPKQNKARDIMKRQEARQKASVDVSAEMEAPKGKRAVADARINELDERITELRNTQGSKQQKLQAKKEANRLQRERDKLSQSVKADVSGERYVVSKSEKASVNEAIREDERKLAKLERQQSYSTDPNSKGYINRQKKIDALREKIATDRQAADKYTVSANRGAAKPADDARIPTEAKPAEAPAPKATSNPEAPKAETPAEAPKADVQAEAPTFRQSIEARRTYGDNDVAVKKAAGNIMDNAPHRESDVKALLDEYDANSKKIAEYKAKKKNSNTPEHIADYDKKIKDLETKQADVANRMTKIESTYVSKYGDGESVVKDLDTADPEKTAKKKTSKLANWWEGVRRKTESSLIEFEKVAKETKNASLTNAVNNVYTARNRAGAWINGTRSSFVDRTSTGKSLNAIFKDAGAFKSKQTRADFNTYALLKHHIDRAEMGEPIFLKDGDALSIPDAQKAMKELADKYGEDKLEQFSKEITEYSNDLLKYRYDAGLITKKAYEDSLAKWEHYVPTYRIDDAEGGLVYNETKGVDINSAFNKLKGADDSPVEDLYTQLYKMTNDVIMNAEQNNMIKLYAEQMGIKPSQLGKEVGVEDLEQARITAGKDNTVSFFSNGERVTMKANEHVVKGLREWNGSDYALLSKFCAAAGKYTGVRGFKGLITDWNVAFGVRNGARDFQQALINSKDTVAFTKSMPKAAHAIMPTSGNNAYRKLYEANGGVYFSPSGDPMRMRDPSKMSFAEKVLMPIETFNGTIEMLPRMCEFIGTIDKEAGKILKAEGKGRTLKSLRAEAEEFVRKNPPKNEADIPGAIEDKYAEMVCGLVGKDGVDRAMYNAADITLNFSRHGAIVKALNSGPVPYLNPSVQGLSKTIRLFTEGKADKALLRIGAKIGGMTIAPAAFNEFMLRDNRDYQNLNTRDKDNNFFIPIGDGKFIKLPKPRENSVAAEPAIYGLRYFFDKAQIGSIKPGEYSSPENWKQMFVTAKDNIGPVNPLTSNYFSPLWNTAHNKTWYGGSIESYSDQELPVSERRDETTSPLANWLVDSKAMKALSESTFAESGVGKLIASNMSPKKVDNLMDSYMGVIYDMFIKPMAPSKTMGSTPANIQNYFTNQFIVDGVYSNKLAEQYYNKLDKLNAKSKDGKYTPKAQTLMNDYGYEIMSLSSARTSVFSGNDKDFSKLSAQDRQTVGRELKKVQNTLYDAGYYDEGKVYGSLEDNFKGDPLRGALKALRKIDFHEKTGKNAMEKVLNTFTFTNKEGKNAVADALKEFKKSDAYGEGGVKKFFNDTIRMRGVVGSTGAGRSYISWTAASLVGVERYNKDKDASHVAIAQSYGASDETLTEANNYLGVGETLKSYIKSHGQLVKMSIKDGVLLNEEDANKQAIKLATKNNADTAYYIEGKYTDYKKNFARCIKEHGMTSKEYNKWMDDNNLSSYSKEPKKGLVEKETENGVYYKSSEKAVISAIEKDYKDMPNEFKAAMYRMFYNFGENPYGEVGDYSLDKDKGLSHDMPGSGGSGGWGRRGYGGGYGGGWGGGWGSGSAGTGAVFGKTKVTDAKTINLGNAPKGDIANAKTTKVKTADLTRIAVGNYTTSSNLDDAYRKRMKKLRESARKSKS